MLQFSVLLFLLVVCAGSLSYATGSQNVEICKLHGAIKFTDKFAVSFQIGSHLKLIVVVLNTVTPVVTAP